MEKLILYPFSDLENFKKSIEVCFHQITIEGTVFSSIVPTIKSVYLVLKSSNFYIYLPTIWIFPNKM